MDGKLCLVADTGVFSIKIGFGQFWVANPNSYPVTMPPQLKVASGHIIVVNEDDSKKSGKSKVVLVSSTLNNSPLNE